MGRLAGSFFVFFLSITVSSCGANKPDDKLECGEGEIARGGQCVEKPVVEPCDEGLVRRGSQCLSQREPFCVNWATNFPECNQCPENFTFKNGRCVCDGADDFCFEQSLCYDPERGKGRSILVLQGYDTGALEGDFLGYNMLPSLNEIPDNTGIEVDIYDYSGDSDADEVTSRITGKEWDAVWMIGGSKVEQFDWKEISKALSPKIEAGSGLVLLGDNDPYSAQIAALMAAIYPDWNLKLEGNYKGEGKVSMSGYASDGKGRLEDHLVTNGLYKNVSEGVTISHVQKVKDGPSIMDKEGFQHLLINTEGNPSVSAMERVLPDSATPYKRAVTNTDAKPVQRTIIHGGFTALYQTGNPNPEPWAWNSPEAQGTPLFFYNMACWSANAY